MAVIWTNAELGISILFVFVAIAQYYLTIFYLRYQKAINIEKNLIKQGLLVDKDHHGFLGYISLLRERGMLKTRTLLRHKFGRIFHMRCGTGISVFVADADVADQVFKTLHLKNDQCLMQGLTGSSILFSNGDTWIWKVPNF